MGDDVKRLVSGYIKEMESRGRAGGASKPVTFSIRLNERDHARLLWLAERLDTPKTPLAERLLRAAVDEAIEQYAGWASPEDPAGYLEEVWESIEGLVREPGGGKAKGRGPHGPGGPKRPKP